METYVIVILLLVLAVVLLVGALVWARKQAARDLARHQQELELLVNERTAELMVTNACLEQEIAQRKRLEEEQVLRRSLNRPAFELDERFLEAVGRMPPSGGIAVGLDRILMLMLGATEIADVLLFPAKEFV